MGGLKYVKAVDLKGEHDFDMKKYRNCRVLPGTQIAFDFDLSPETTINHYSQKVILRLATARKEWANTHRSELDDLSALRNYMAVRGLTFQSLTEDDIKDYLGCLIDGISVKTGRPFAASTIRRRASTIVNIGRFLFSEHYISQPIITFGLMKLAKITDDHEEQPVRSVAELYNDLPRADAPDERIRPFVFTNLVKVLETIGPEEYDPQRPFVDRICAEFATACGIRVDEISSLDLSQIYNLIPQLDESDPWKYVSLRLQKSKGSKREIILIPQYMIKRILYYIETERAHVAEIAKTVGNHRSESRAVFLNTHKANHRDIGQRRDPQVISRSFQRAVIAVGLLTDEERYLLDDAGNPIFDATTGDFRKVWVKVPAHSFHDTRHTFAITSYKEFKAQGNLTPLKDVQRHMRHKLLQTTSDTYLRWVDEHEVEASDAFSQYLKRVDRYGAAI